MSTEFGAVAIAILALLFSVAQWFGTRRSERLRLLLGEMETVGFEAIRIARGRAAFLGRDVIHALVLSTLFEGSDRARLMVYRALDSIRTRHEGEIVAFRAELVSAADHYKAGVGLANFHKRLRQLDAALPWVVGTTARQEHS